MVSGRFAFFRWESRQSSYSPRSHALRGSLRHFISTLWFYLFLYNMHVIMLTVYSILIKNNIINLLLTYANINVTQLLFPCYGVFESVWCKVIFAIYIYVDGVIDIFSHFTIRDNKEDWLLPTIRYLRLYNSMTQAFSSQISIKLPICKKLFLYTLQNQCEYINSKVD